MNNNKLDRVIEALLEGVDTKELWHVVFNKMTNAAKRQMIGEMLNTILGGEYSTQSNIFKDKGEE